jgi:hypothetical protein
MSRRKSKLSPDAITTTPNAAPVLLPQTPSPEARVRAVAFTALVLVAGAGVLYTLWERQIGPFERSEQDGEMHGRTKRHGVQPGRRSSEQPVDGWTKLIELARQGKLRSPQTDWRPQPWEPKSESDKVIDRFVKLHEGGDAAALKLLAGKPLLVEEEELPESAFDARSTDTFLRQKFAVKNIWRGEPDGAGGQKETPGRYTLACEGAVQTPLVRVRGARGEGKLTSGWVTNPELVVAVRDGKIYGVRAESPR